MLLAKPGTPASNLINLKQAFWECPKSNAQQLGEKRKRYRGASNPSGIVSLSVGNLELDKLET